MVVIVTLAFTGRRKDAAEVLLKGDAGFFRDPGWVGIDGPEKILDLVLNFPLDLNLELRTVWCGDPP